MRLVDPGTLKGFANETTMSNHLFQYAITEPEILNQAVTLFPRVATFQTLLADRNLTAKGLFADMKTDNYTVVGNTKVKWPVKSLHARKGVILGFEAEDTTYPSRYGSVVKLKLDTNWFSPYDALELADNNTIVTVVDDMLPQEIDTGIWLYYVRLNRSREDDYIDPTLLEEGKEIGFAYTNFYEMSETAYEKYTFDDMASSTLTIQRMKWSISGTASQMNVRKHWVTHNGEMAWMTHQELKMLERWAAAREFQLIRGKGTVSKTDKIMLKDMKGRDIRSGDGLLNIGDGSLKFPFNNLNKRTIDNVLENLSILSNNDGVMEVAAVGGKKFMTRFGQIMRDEFKVTAQELVEGSGREKGVNATFSYYELDGVRIVPVWSKWFDDMTRPSEYAADGSRKLSWNAFFTSLGNTEAGNPNVELITLGDRQFKKGTVAGINQGGEKMQTSVDGEHTHILSETGIVSKDEYGTAELYHV